MDVVLLVMMDMVAVFMVVSVMLLGKRLEVDVRGLGEVHERRHSLEVHQADGSSGVIVDLHV